MLRELDTSVRTERELGLEAFRSEHWDEAISALENTIRRGAGDRGVLLCASSAHARLGHKATAGAYTLLANRLYPSRSYDSSAAFEVYADAPFERDELAEFLAANATALRTRAEVACAKAAVPSAADTPRIFVYWDTDERPPLVELSIASMRHNLPPGVELVELNEKTLRDWVVLDPALVARVEREANRSDLIRLHLLAEHGGLWLDATCFLNPGFANLFDQISAEDFFLYTYRGSRTGSWCFWGTPTSYRVQVLREALELWLMSGRPWTNYFMFHDFVEMLYWTDERYRQEWDSGLHLHPGEALALLRSLGKTITDEDWQELRNRSPINKLSWKFSEDYLSDPLSGVSRLLAEKPDTADTEATQ